MLTGYLLITAIPQIIFPANAALAAFGGVSAAALPPSSRAYRSLCLCAWRCSVNAHSLLPSSWMPVRLYIYSIPMCSCRALAAAAAAAGLFRQKSNMFQVGNKNESKRIK